MSHKGNKLNIMEDSNPSEGLMAACTNLARRIVRLPLNIVGAISRTLGNAAARRNPASNPDPQQQREQNDGILIIPEEWFFLTLFERQFGESHPFFYACRFAEALKIAKDESKLVFLYLHSPQSPLTALFCHDTLCSQLVIEFLDANFVSWGAVASRGEGLEMASGLQASTFPFCAVVAPATGKAIVVLQQVANDVY